MNAESIKHEVCKAIGRAIDNCEYVLSATLTGSFLEAQDLEDISDIDTVVVVDRLNAERFRFLCDRFVASLGPVLGAAGYKLRLNTWLGPLKFNEPDTAVLHLMIYTHRRHIEHAIQSPFTCFDWQRSPVHWKRSLAELYPVFGLQPRHFLSARRGIRDYLRGIEEGAVFYRELVCDDVGCTEQARAKPMTPRDRVEFAYHVMRFLMLNLVKLVTRQNRAWTDDALVEQYQAIFPDKSSLFGELFRKLGRHKRSADSNSTESDALNAQLRDFADTFEAQFRSAFLERASRHVAFRHCKTSLNKDTAEDRVFLGRTDPPIETPPDAALTQLASVVSQIKPSRVLSSPMLRCRQSLAALSSRLPETLPGIEADDRLREIEYGACEGLAGPEARRRYPELFAAWAEGQDPAFPEGECSADVLRRAKALVEERWSADGDHSLVCTHNVVLRVLVGDCLGVPLTLWHRLNFPHLTPITFVQTRFGLYVDLDEETERKIFANFAVEQGT